MHEFPPIEPEELYALEVPQSEASEMGRDVVRIGDIELAQQTWEQPGPESGAGGGLTATANCLRMYGVDVNEQDAVRAAAERGLCNIGATTQTSGGCTANDRAAFFKAFNVPVQLKVMSHLAQIVEAVRDGQGVLADVNAGALWRDELGGPEGEQAYRDHYHNGEANHVVQVIGLANDRESNELLGFYVNDPGDDAGAARFVSKTAMQAAAIGTPERPVLGDIITTRFARRTND